MTDVSEFEQIQSGSLKRYLEIPKRRPWHIVVPCVGLALIALGASFLAHKKYKTQTMILIESEKVPESIVQRGDDQQTKPRTATIRQEILSRTRIEKVLKEINPYPEVMGREPLTNIIEQVRTATEINVKGNEAAFTIEYVHRDPKKAMEVANRLATLFIDESVKSREEQVEGAADFLATQLDDAKKQLDEKDREVRRYKELHTGRLPEQTGANLASLERFQMERQNIETQLSAARQREIMLERGIGDTVMTTTPSGAVVAVDPSRDLAKAKEDLAVMRTRYTDEHPDVRAQQARIEKLERDVAEAERRAASSVVPSAPATGNRIQLEQVRGEIRSLEVRKANVEAQMGAYQGRVDDAPRTEQELKTLTRDFEQLNENFKQLLTKKLNAQMTERMEKRWKGERFRILDPAYVPESPYYPNRTVFTLAGAVLGLLVGLGLAFGAELFDPSVKDQDELSELVPHPVLVTFPSIPNVISTGRSGRDGGGGYGDRSSADVLELDEWRARGKASSG